MKQEVRLSYQSKGLRPPVYVVTSLSEPQWEPKELHSKVLDDDNELEFWRVFEAEEGEHQYKFRLGPGDWWALDETKPIVEDEFGNKNNVIHVGAATSKSDRQSEPTPVLSQKTARYSPRSSMEEPIPRSISPAQSNPLGITHDVPQSPIEDSKQKFTQLRVGPAEPLTPPMTPEMSEKLATDYSKFQPFPTGEIQRPASTASRPNSRPVSMCSCYSDKSIEEAMPIDNEIEEKTAMPKQTRPEAQQQQMGMIESVKYFLITLGTWMVSIFGGGMRMTGILAVFVGIAAILYKIRDLRNAVMPFILSMLYPQAWGRRGNDTSMV
ncbi:hypothetical protein K461DRAFT_178788 [Myriangium duriaei CBS 260.36]|uniref:AMP-activated protein kinase glycogen-binding domain-containing protein n=1 Tax=Myriangium duriaei CBS 260.36 TaxID=1168546 RepID=A0A9P4J1C7_9PEZI|nr:hypothetical protein K461DRAFT_178788 [Myriangium duriaei CBS 260.36]